MCDARAMRVIERARDLGRENEPFGKLQSAFLESRRQGFPFQVLHDEKRGALLLADVIERTDVGMIELGDDARLAIEPLAELRVGRKRRRQYFDCDCAIESGVARFVDFAL